MADDHNLGFLHWNYRPMVMYLPSAAQIWTSCATSTISRDSLIWFISNTMLANKTDDLMELYDFGNAAALP